MHNTAIIRGDRGKIELKILDRQNPRAENISDANWLSAMLSVEAGPFSGSIRLSMTTNELSMFHEQIVAAVKTLEGDVDFMTMEGNFRLSAIFSKTGAINIAGIVTNDEAEKNSIHYGFDVDPITLESFTSSLGLLAEQFPIYLP